MLTFIMLSNTAISITTLYNDYMVTAARELDDDIRLDLWRITNAGSIVHEASTIAGRGSFANVVQDYNGHVVAAFRDEQGQLSTQKFSISTQYDQFYYHSGWVSSQTGKVKASSYNDHYIVATFITAADAPSTDTPSARRPNAHVP